MSSPIDLSMLLLYEREVTEWGMTLEQSGRKWNLNESTCGVQVRRLLNTSLGGGLQL